MGGINIPYFVYVIYEQLGISVFIEDLCYQTPASRNSQTIDADSGGKQIFKSGGILVGTVAIVIIIVRLRHNCELYWAIFYRDGIGLDVSKWCMIEILVAPK